MLERKLSETQILAGEVLNHFGGIISYRNQDTI